MDRSLVETPHDRASNRATTIEERGLGFLFTIRTETKNGNHRPLSRRPARPRLRRCGRHDGRIQAARQFRTGDGYDWRLTVSSQAGRVDRRHVDGALSGDEPSRMRPIRCGGPDAALLSLDGERLPGQQRQVLRHWPHRIPCPACVQENQRAV